MNYIKYYPDTRIKVQKIDSNGIDHNMILVPTNITRHASEILDRIDMHDKSSLLMELSKQADFYAEHYPEIISYSTALNEAWKMKKALEKNISNPEIDEMYDRCIKAGALGAKLLGAGGGGFMLLWSDTNNIEKVKSALDEYLTIPFRVDYKGSEIIYHEEVK